MYMISITYNDAMKNSAKTLWDNQLVGLWPCLKGSLAKVYKPCIRPNCPVCRNGTKHPAWLFSYSQNGKRSCLYVPLGAVKTMARALKNGRRLEKLLFRIGPALLQEYRQSLKTKEKRPPKS